MIVIRCDQIGQSNLKHTGAGRDAGDSSFVSDLRNTSADCEAGYDEQQS